MPQLLLLFLIIQCIMKPHFMIVCQQGALKLVTTPVYDNNATECDLTL